MASSSSSKGKLEGKDCGNKYGDHHSSQQAVLSPSKDDEKQHEKESGESIVAPELLLRMTNKDQSEASPPHSQHVVPNCKDVVDIEIEKMLLEAGALRARDLANHDSDHCREGCNKPSHNHNLIIVKPRREYLCCVLLLMATMVAKITYQAAFTLPAAGTLKEGYAYNYATNGTLQLKKRDSSVAGSFILFNSTGFVASVAVIIFLLHEFPLKPWPQILVSTLFGSYMCLIMATSPREGLPLLFLAIPFLLLAAAGKVLLGFARPRSY